MPTVHYFIAVSYFTSDTYCPSSIAPFEEKKKGDLVLKPQRNISETKRKTAKYKGCVIWIDHVKGPK